MVTSIWMANLAWVLLGVNWLLEGRWPEKWRMARASRLLQAYLGLCLIYVVGMLWTEHLATGLHVLQVKLPLLVVPLVLLTSRPLEGNARRLVQVAHAGTVLVVSLIALWRMLTVPYLPYRDAVPFVSHIRFALNCCIVIYFCAIGIHRLVRSRGDDGHRRWQVVALVALALWMLAFLLLIRSYTAIAVLAAATLCATVASRRRWPLLALWAVVALAGCACVWHEARGYYRMVPQATEPLRAYTAGSRPYVHAQDGIVENGNYINNYICREELCNEWQRRSAVPYDSVGDEGFGVHHTLVRYLNSQGLTKDSVGLWQLSDSQIHDVEQGVANPVYTGRNPIRKMVYVMLFEREFYLHTHAVRGFSMLQRLELWRTGWQVVQRNRWVGVGTGDVRAELQAELLANDSELAGSDKKTHNQYLTLLVAFGVVGFAAVVVLFLRPLASRTSRRMSALMLAWTLTILVSCLTEDTLDTLPGILFCTYFLAFRPPCTNITPSATDSE